MLDRDPSPVGELLAGLDRPTVAADAIDGPLHRRRIELCCETVAAAVVADPTQLRDCIVQIGAQQPHPAPSGTDVVEHLPLLDPAQGGHLLDASPVERPVRESPLPASADAFDSALHLQILQELLQGAALHVEQLEQFRDGERLGRALQYCHDPVGQVGRRERRTDEEVLNVGVLAAAEQDSPGLPEGSAGTPDLLVVGDRRTGRLVVDDEGEIGLVEPHAQG